MGLELGPKTLSRPRARRSRESPSTRLKKNIGARPAGASCGSGLADASGLAVPERAPRTRRHAPQTAQRGGAPTPAPDDDDAATLSPGGKLRAELSRRASERVAVAVSDMRQKLAELDGAAVPESDVARAVGVKPHSRFREHLGDDQARAPRGGRGPATDPRGERDGALALVARAVSLSGNLSLNRKSRWRRRSEEVLAPGGVLRRRGGRRGDARRRDQVVFGTTLTTLRRQPIYNQRRAAFSGQAKVDSRCDGRRPR